MASYFQMGSDTENLVGCPGLGDFSGIILSPVNREPNELRRYLGEFRVRGQFDVVLDPQLYVPRVGRSHLPSHPYFPSDVDTADLSSPGWFRNVASKVAGYAIDLGVDAAASPVNVPSRWTDGYFEMCVESHVALSAGLAGKPIRALLTLPVRLADLSSPADAMRIASICTSRNAKGCYLVIEADVSPRKELQAAENLASLMVLIAALEKAGCRVLVSHCSSDMVLFKAAGASDCSSGKFFNLRRFTRGRYEEDEKDGGRQLPYWFEHGLFAFLREADVQKIRRDWGPEHLMVEGSLNQFGVEILHMLGENRRYPWIALGWRQYLAWFGATELRTTGRGAFELVDGWLRLADQAWKTMDDQNILLDERFNDGSWVRKWRQALQAFRKAVAVLS